MSSYLGAIAGPPAATLPRPAEPAWLAEPACCCNRGPRFCVRLPTAAAELLLCPCHLQISLPRLAELGAWIHDARDRLLFPADWL